MAYGELMRSRTGRRTAGTCLVALAVGVVAACGSSSHTSAPATSTPTTGASGSAATGASGAGATRIPTGKPVVLFTEVDLIADFPDVGVGMKAAAKAINGAGGIKDPGGGPNRPVSIVVCQDNATANGAADCGREAVSDHAVAVIGTETGFGSVFDPIVFGAGIPIVAQGAYASPDELSPLSFPIANGQASGPAGGFTRLAEALGVKSVYVIGSNLPQFTSLLPAIAHSEQVAGVKQAGVSLVNSSTTSTPDMLPYAAAAAASGAGLIFMDIGPYGVLVMKSLLTQGINFEKTAVVADSNVVSAQDLAPLGAHANGVYFIGNSYPATYTANPAVRQYDNEVSAYGDTTTPRTEGGEQAWEGVHLVADMLAKVPTISSAALVAAMNNAGPISPGLTPPFDWSKPAFSTGFQSKFRVFTNEIMVSRVISGVVTPIVSGYVPLGQPFQISNAAGQLSR